MCGADLDPKARACPECGSDESTGWSKAAEEDPLGLETEEFNYKRYIEEELEGKVPPSPAPWVKWVVWFLIIVFIAWLISNFSQ